MKASTLPFSAASANAGTAVVDEDSEDDESDAQHDGQDGPEEGGVALRKQDLQIPGKQIRKAGRVANSDWFPRRNNQSPSHLGTCRVLRGRDEGNLKKWGILSLSS